MLLRKISFGRSQARRKKEKRREETMPHHSELEVNYYSGMSVVYIAEAKQLTGGNGFALSIEKHSQWRPNKR